MNNFSLPPSAALSARITRFIPPLLVFLLAFALFAPSIAYPLVDYDDTLFITNNTLVNGGLSLRSVLEAFAPTLHGDASMYSPLLWISWMTDVSVFGATPAHPWPFHLGNVFLHALNALLLFFLLRRCKASPLPAALLALLWACHPLRVESVAWVTERKDTLSTFFALLSILAYLKAFSRSRSSGAEPPPSTRCSTLVTCHSRNGLLFLSFLALLLGLLVKPMLVTLPFLFLLFDVFPIGRLSLDRSFSLRTALRLLLEKIPFFALSAAASAVSLLTQSNAIQHDSSLFSRLALVPLHYAFYLIKTFIPIRLTPFYHSIVFTWGGFLPFAILFAVLFVSAWRQRNTHPAWSLGILAFFGLFVPVVGFFHVGIHHFADRYAYLPSIGLSVAAIPLLSSPSPRIRFPSLAIALLALAAMIPLTLRVLPHWSSDDAFYANAARYTPEHPFVVERNAQLAIAGDGDFAAAEAILDQSLAQAFESADVYRLKAVCVDERLGPEAALDILLSLPRERYNQACCYDAAQYALRLGRWDDARYFSRAGRALVPPSSTVAGDFLELDFAAACLSGDLAAIADAARALSVSHPDPSRREYFRTHKDFSLPDLLPYYRTQWNRFHVSDAWAFYRKLIPLAQDNPWNLRTIAGLLAAAQGWSPAPPETILELARRADELAPGEPEILDVLAAAQANAGLFDEAVATASRALSLAPPGSPFAALVASHLDLYRSGYSLRK